MQQMVLMSEKVHQCRSAVNTTGRVLRSLFKTAWLCWMCKFSNIQHVVLCWCWSITSNWLRSIAWPILNMCSARADAWMSPFFSTRWCSLTCCFKHHPVWPLHTLRQSMHGMHSSFALICWDWVLLMYQHMPENSQGSKHFLDFQGVQDTSSGLRKARVVGQCEGCHGLCPSTSSLLLLEVVCWRMKPGW